MKSRLGWSTRQTLKILLITRKWPPAVGGMETYSVELVDELRRLGHEVEVIALPGRGDGRPPSTVALVLFGIVTVFRVLVGRRHPEAVIGGDMAVWPLVLAACLGVRGAPRPILAAHGTDVSLAYRADTAGRLYRRYLCLGGRWLGRRGVRIAANSGATGARARALGFRAVRIIPLGCRPDPEPDPWRFGRDLVFAGRLQVRKGLGWFVTNVLPRLPADIRLKVAGPEWDAAEALALGHPRVDYLGALPRERVYAEMAGALAVVVPNIREGVNLFEGFGLVAVEAASMGAPVLAPRIDGFRASVRHGHTGTLLPPGDADAWVAAITQLAEMPRGEMETLRRGRMTAAREFYSWERVARQTADLARD